MRQSQLNEEAQKCDHGYFFGTTCEYCQLLDLQDRVVALEKGLEEAALMAESMVLRVELGTPLSQSKSVTVFAMLAKEARKVLEDGK
ncbi:hypothetical protein LCGC14_1677500 [marine sediment metagenome]|uniref:Uncharacterized protein n=1 Tax=marine sediment metagenome TaxID=412755 RepID=A0A0F9HPP1_9ZZZZ